jgi:hypothetical protein
LQPKLCFIIEGEGKTFHEKKLKQFMTLNLHCRRYLKDLYIEKRKINTTRKIWERIDLLR